MANSESQRVTVPLGAPAWISAALIEETLRVWQPYYANPLTVEDAIDIMQAVGQLVKVLSCESSRL
jgi:hypothetical protein